MKRRRILWSKARQPGQSTVLLLFHDGRRISYSFEVVAAIVQRRDNIQLDIYFVQLAENYNHQLGVGWPTTLGANYGLNLAWNGNVGPGSPSTTSATLAVQVLPRLDFLQASGWARVMRHASVVTANGEEAALDGGEEFNVLASSGIQANLQSVRAGADLVVTPRYDPESELLDLTLNVRMSDLSQTAGGVPGRLYADVRTTVNMEIGQSLIIGGLVSDSQSETRTGLPFLSQIPIIGALFGTHQNRRNYSQTVMFVVPSVLDNVREHARARIGEALETYWEFHGGLDETQLFNPPSGIWGGAPQGSYGARALGEGAAAPPSPAVDGSPSSEPVAPE